MAEKINFQEKLQFKTFKELFDALELDETFAQISWILDAPTEMFNAVNEDFFNKYKEELTFEKMKEQINNNEISLLEMQEEINETLNIFTELFDKTSSELPQDRIDFFLKMLTMIRDAFYNFPNRKIVDVGIEKIDKEAILPTYAHEGDAGADIYANETVTIDPMQIALISTGLKVEVPMGYEIQIRPRSGMSVKTPIRIPNAPGTIDYGYYDELKIICQNLSNEEYTINKGDRIAQMFIKQVPMINWVEKKVGNDDTNRQGGFGSSGK